MKIWIEVSKDAYELPIAIADTAKELAATCGTSLKMVTKSASIMNSGHNCGHFCRYRSIKVDDDD